MKRYNPDNYYAMVDEKLYQISRIGRNELEQEVCKLICFVEEVKANMKNTKTLIEMLEKGTY